MRSVQGARHCKSSLNFERASVLPLEGKGDRSAVDEVNSSLTPLRGAFQHNFPNTFNGNIAAITLSGLWSLVTKKPDTFRYRVFSRAERVYFTVKFTGSPIELAPWMPSLALYVPAMRASVGM